VSKITPGHYALPAEGIAKGNRYMTEAFHCLLKCEACGRQVILARAISRLINTTFPSPPFLVKQKTKD